MRTIQAAAEIIALVGGTWDASLNHYDTGGGCMATTQQVDEWVFVVAQDDFLVGRHTLDEWLGESAQTDVPLIDCLDAEGAWLMLKHLREDCLVWQCGACDAWIFTIDRPRVGSCDARPAATAASTSASRSSHRGASPLMESRRLVC